MNELNIKVPQNQYFGLSAYEVLRGMIRLYGVLKVQETINEILVDDLTKHSNIVSTSTSAKSYHSNETIRKFE